MKKIAIKEKLTKHDQEIKLLMEIAKKLDNHLDNIAQNLHHQEIVFEKLLATKKEYENRVEKIEEVIEDIGCNNLKLLIKDTDNLKEKVSKINDTIKWISRSLIGSLITGAIASLFIFARQ
jgi:septation ring formation regulator EzrA